MRGCGCGSGKGAGWVGGTKRGRVMGERAALAFKILYILDLNLFDLINFGLNLNTFMRVLFNIKPRPKSIDESFITYWASYLAVLIG